MLSVSNLLVVLIFLVIWLARFNRFLICLFCIEGAMSALFLAVLTKISLSLSGGVVFFVTVTVAGASVGLALLVAFSRSQGSVNSRVSSLSRV